MNRLEHLFIEAEQLPEDKITEIAKECNFDLTGQLLKFARLIEQAQQRANDRRLASDITEQSRCR